MRNKDAGPARHAVCKRISGIHYPFQRGAVMNKDQLEGVGKKVKGKVNELVGKATGNTTQQIKGELQQGAGEVQKQYGNVKEELRKGRS